MPGTGVKEAIPVPEEGEVHPDELLQIYYEGKDVATLSREKLIECICGLYEEIGEIKRHGAPITVTDTEGTVEDSPAPDQDAIIENVNKDTWLSVEGWAKLFDIDPGRLYGILDDYVGTHDGETNSVLDNLVPVWNIGHAIIGLDETANLEAGARHEVEKKLKDFMEGAEAPDQEPGEGITEGEWEDKKCLGERGGWHIYSLTPGKDRPYFFGHFYYKADARTAVIGKKMVDRTQQLIFSIDPESELYDLKKYYQDMKDMLALLKEVDDG
jgi:hypothetical protein